MSNDPQNAQAAQAAMAARHRAAPAIQPVALRPGHMSNTAINAVIGRLIIVKGVRQNMTYNIEYTYSNKPGLPCIVHSAPAQQAQDASASLLNWLTGLLQSEDWLGWVVHAISAPRPGYCPEEHDITVVLVPGVGAKW